MHRSSKGRFLDPLASPSIHIWIGNPQTGFEYNWKHAPSIDAQYTARENCHMTVVVTSAVQHLYAQYPFLLIHALPVILARAF